MWEECKGGEFSPCARSGDTVGARGMYGKNAQRSYMRGILSYRLRGISYVVAKFLSGIGNVAAGFA